MTLEERLSALLDEKDDVIAERDQKIEELERSLRGVEDGWAAHRDAPKEQSLPVPRLEMELTKVSDFAMEWEYRMVMRHFLGHCVIVPLGFTTSTGSVGDQWPPRERGLDNKVRMRLPYRDGCHFNHDTKALGWPAFMVCDGVVEAFVPWGARE